MEGHVGVVIDNLDVVRTYLNEARALDDVRRARVLAARDRYEGVLREILTEGAADGSFGPDVDKIDAIFILSVLNALERWYHPDGPVDRSPVASSPLIGMGSGGSTIESWPPSK